ncbi:hypothetical protein RIR_jg26362.t1 [Rhizophagus irregularis DAOM 181602=DAOM 197198]|nr:hypothetical protein RIR_jg26362.t1 [Rhizophagus irregularis DAOM 181602=DAOM 197198]
MEVMELIDGLSKLSNFRTISHVYCERIERKKERKKIAGKVAKINVKGKWHIKYRRKFVRIFLITLKNKNLFLSAVEKKKIYITTRMSFFFSNTNTF